MGPNYGGWSKARIQASVPDRRLSVPVGGRQFGWRFLSRARRIDGSAFAGTLTAGHAGSESVDVVLPKAAAQNARRIRKRRG